MLNRLAVLLRYLDRRYVGRHRATKPAPAPPVPAPAELDQALVSGG